MSLIQAIREGYQGNNDTVVRPEVDSATMESAFADSAYTDAAMVELTQSLYKVQEAFDVADIMGEYAVIEGTMEVETVLEGMLSSSFEKIKTAFQTFWKKITAFFEQVKKTIKAFFTRGEKFVKEYENDLKKKDTKDFKFTGYPYSVSAGDDKVSAVSNKVADQINSVLVTSEKSIADLKDMAGDEGTVADKVNANKDINAINGKTASVSDYVETVIKSISNLGASDVTEMKEKVTLAYRGDEDSAIEIEDFNKGANLAAMIEYIKSNNKTISALEKEQKKFDSDLSAIIKKIDAFANKKDTQGEAYKAATGMSSKLTALLNLRKSAVDVQVSMHKEIAGAYDSCLHKLLGYKKKAGVEESTTVVPQGAQSLMEAALAFVN